MKLLGRRRPPSVTTQETCGCCARGYPRSAVHELGNAPGVFVCRRCALWMTTKMGQ